jgi:hypothetical protein
MLFRRFAVLLGIVVCALIHCIEPVANAGMTGQPPLLIVQQSVRLDEAQSAARFSITFSRSPDFVTMDSDGRRADSFQYEIAPGFTSISQTSLDDIRAIVRGDEIGPRLLPIRAGISNGSDPSPASGGWGHVRASVPFMLQGDTLSFLAPLADLDAGDGVFAYRVFTTQFGETTSLVSGSSAVSLPPAVWVGGGMLLIMSALYVRVYERGHVGRRSRGLGRRKSDGESRAGDRLPNAKDR